MKVIAKCHNYTGCVLAYKGDKIELDSGAALVCPECGKSVVLGPSGGSWMKTTLLLSLGVVVLGGAIALFAYPLLRSGGKTTPPSVEPATPKPNPAKSGSSEPVKTPPVGAAPAEPPPVAVAVTKIEDDVNRAENKSVKAEVLTRIDLMPNISQANKDRLYTSVERARSMGKIVTVPFGSGGVSVTSSDVDILKNTLESPMVTKLRDDPTLVFVILGYADAKGDDKRNLAISQARADSVVAAMKNKCGVQNVMHAVAMGSSKLLDEQNLEKNRIVEVWAAKP